MIVLRWREMPRVQTRWRTPGKAPAPVRATQPAVAAATIVGRQGRQGNTGPPGPPGDGATDPGDLTLYFDNGLIQGG